jgi:FkbM family methyltransferase
MKAFRLLVLRIMRAYVFGGLVLYTLLRLRLSHLIFLIKYRKFSTGQLYQDLIVIATLPDLSKLEDFYFVEFGATDGISISNSQLFEKSFGARGILSEPAKVWHENLKKNRNCNISTSCVWSSSGELMNFDETSNPDLSRLSTITSKNKPNVMMSYSVETVSLKDLLDKFSAPTVINFMSIDTEGTEFEILKGFDFSSYRIGTIVCEHNFRRDRKDIKMLLESQGYEQKLRPLGFFDDWYFLRR